MVFERKFQNLILALIVKCYTDSYLRNLMIFIIDNEYFNTRTVKEIKRSHS